jgi:hypothetical protein
MTARVARRDALFDLLVASPQGVTVDEIAFRLVCSLNRVRLAIRDLRIFLGDDDTINVPCRPQGTDERWLYTLESGLTDSTRIWSANRIGDTETRLHTMHAVSSSAVAATDERTIEGRKARVIERGLRRTIEDLEEIDADF